MPLFPDAVSDLSPAQLIVLRECMIRLHAQDELAKGVADEHLYDAMIAAGYTPEQAGDAVSDRVMESLKRAGQHGSDD